MSDLDSEKDLYYAARSRLNNLGAINHHACIANDPGRMERMRSRTELAASIGDLQRIQRRLVEEKAAKELENLRPLFPKAVRMYRSGERGNKFTKDMIRAILLFAFKEAPAKKSGRKEEWIRQLNDLDKGDMNGCIDQALVHMSTCNAGNVEADNGAGEKRGDESNANDNREMVNQNP